MMEIEEATKVRAALTAITAASAVASVRGILNNAGAQLQEGRITPQQHQAIQRTGWRRLAELAGQDANDPLARRWIEGIAAFEALTGKRASRTRPMLERHGAKRAFEKLVDRNSGTSGFDQMIEAGLHDMTAEWIVLEFADMFDPRIREVAEQRLAAARVTLRP